jgi:pyocin large subunit-like protein
MVFMNDEDWRYTRPQEDIEAMRAENQPSRPQTATVKPAPIEANVGKRSAIGTVTAGVEVRRPRLLAERFHARRTLLPVPTDPV